MPDTPPNTPEDPLTYKIFNEIGIIDQLATAAFRRALPPPLNPSMFGVLNHFVRLGDGKTPSYLADAFQVTRPSMTSILEKLKAAGFVEIETHPDDARGKIVRITQEGREARTKAVEATEPLFASIEPALQGVDREALHAMLAHVRAALDQAR